jgi:maleate cis-trans isomerase
MRATPLNVGVDRQTTSEPLAREKGRLATPLARIGVILPTSNRLIEPQFVHYAPVELGIHFARAQLTGRWKKPLVDLAPEIARAAITLADARPDLIVFNCTSTSMKEGPEGDAYLLGAIREATGIEPLSTAAAVTTALSVLGMQRFVLVTPYIQATNDHEIEYFRQQGFQVVHDVALGLSGGDEFIHVPPERWIDLALSNDRADSDGFLLACTNTTQIEAIDAVEGATGKPVVNSNQAVLWAALNRLRTTFPTLGRGHIPGRLAGVEP